MIIGLLTKKLVLHQDSEQSQIVSILDLKDEKYRFTGDEIDFRFAFSIMNMTDPGFGLVEVD